MMNGTANECAPKAANRLSSLFSVITTIQAPTASVNELLARLAQCSGTLVVAGDKKGPFEYRPRLKGSAASAGDPSGVQFLSLRSQLEGPFELARQLPVGHYCRKNVGYLHAIAQGASCLYETDDDNAPLSTWGLRTEYLENIRVVNGAPAQRKNGGGWVNVYKYFTDAHIWPRGLPLDEIHSPVPPVEDRHKAESKGQRSEVRGQRSEVRSQWSVVSSPSSVVRGLWSPIQQGLVNGSPDVDAIWHLVLDRPFEFESRPSVFLPPGNWCPFNTQSTWWWPVAYPLIYVPSYCSFRMADIWKSFIAQRCLWEPDAGVAFHAPEVFQDRNPHDLMKDFRDEIPGYDRNRELIRVLEALDLKRGQGAVALNLRSCYEALVNARFFPDKELALVDAWLSDLAKIGS